MVPRWVVVVPVKELRLAKTRLTEFTAQQRAEIALAAARDVVAAAAGCPLVDAVYVVTNDLLAADTLGGDGARVIADTADSGLNPALEDGARIAAGWHPRAGVAALSADLPALTPAELGEALGAAGAPRCFVTDHARSGTTMLTAAPGVPLVPSFGPASRELHLRSGAVELLGDWPGLRRDVDTAADLAAAAAGPLGEHTAAVLRRVWSPR
ncbi:MAG: 2-phospho-L-lactate/phosphoenolpyruvate guanylyltransferase [Frankiaceae bacterium]|jgi:2-phospho-L-lactate guanylyltransferase|nr:2-phospho-L-lactate/phosphoenolpyruvate guanylyltransferase [Frankiaceae bacterium]